MVLKRWIMAGLFLLFATPAAAHGDHVAVNASPWTMWQLSPEILLSLVIIALIYWRGSRHGLVGSRWRIASFYGGLLALFIALISPVEQLADHIFAVHQVEHMLLRSVAPLLIFLSQPQAAVVRGLPKGVSKFFASTGWLRSLVSFLRYPLVATLLFLSASYFWMLPYWHDVAILDEPIHYMWHISLLATGLIFFSVLFDHRAAPQGAGLGTRLAMFAAAALGNIVLGTFLSLKTIPLYSAYLTLGHMWNVSMLTDEQTGGVIMWIPGSMMFGVAALVIIHRWSVEETRNVERRTRTGRDVVAATRPANKLLAFGLAGFALIVLLIAVSVVAVIDHPYSATHQFGMAGQIPG